MQCLPQPLTPGRWFLYADLIAVLIAVMLPWSTTAVGVLGFVWLLALIPLLPTRRHLRKKCIL